MMVKPNKFLQMQQEKLVSESFQYQLMKDNQKLRVVSIGKAGKEQILQWIKWKQDLINLIKNSDKKALNIRLESAKDQLCPKCKKGLKKFELPQGHGYEAKNFIICEYITRGLKQDV